MDSKPTKALKEEKFKNDCLECTGAIPGSLALVAVHKDYFAKECRAVLEVVPALKCPGYEGASLSLLKNFTFPDFLPWTPLLACGHNGDDLTSSKWVHKAICIQGADCFPDSLDHPQLNKEIESIKKTEDRGGKPAGNEDGDSSSLGAAFSMSTEDVTHYVVYVLATHDGLVEFAAGQKPFRLLPATLRTVLLKKNSAYPAKVIFACPAPSQQDDHDSIETEFHEGGSNTGWEEDDHLEDEEDSAGENVPQRFAEYAQKQASFRSRLLSDQALCYVEHLRRLVPELTWRDVVELNRAVASGHRNGKKMDGLKRRLLKGPKTGTLKAIALDCLLHYMKSVEAPAEDLDVTSWPLWELPVWQRQAYYRSMAGALCPVIQDSKGAVRNICYTFCGIGNEQKSSASNSSSDKVYSKVKSLTLSKPAPLNDLADLCRLLAFDKPLIAEALKMGCLYRGAGSGPLPPSAPAHHQQRPPTAEEYPKVLGFFRQIPSTSNCWNRLGMQTRSGSGGGGDDPSGQPPQQSFLLQQQPQQQSQQSQQQQQFIKNDHVTEAAHSWYLQQRSEGGSQPTASTHPIKVWRPYYTEHNALNAEQHLFPGKSSLDDFVDSIRSLWNRVEECSEKFNVPASGDDSQKNIAVFHYNLSKSAYHFSPLQAHCFLASLFHQFVQLVYGTNIDVDFADGASALKWFLDGCTKHVLNNMQNDTCGLKTKPIGIQASWNAALPVDNAECIDFTFPSGPDLTAFISLSHKTTLYGQMSDKEYSSLGDNAITVASEIDSCYHLLRQWSHAGVPPSPSADPQIGGLDRIGKYKLGTFLLDSALSGPAGADDPESFLLSGSGQALGYIGMLVRLLVLCWGDARVSNVSEFLKMLCDAILAKKIGLPVGIKPMSRLVALLPYFHREKRQISYYREHSVQEFHRSSPFVVSSFWFISFSGKRKNNKLFYRMTNQTIHYLSYPDIHAKLSVRVGAGAADRREIYCIVVPSSQYTERRRGAHGGTSSVEDGPAEKIARKMATWGGTNPLKRRQALLQHLPELAQIIKTELTDVEGGQGSLTVESVHEICAESNVPAMVKEKLLILLGLDLARDSEEEPG